MPDVFEYLDYRKLLKDLYEDRKKEHSYFSYRYIAQKVGFASAGFFANIIQGKRNISSEFIFKFAEVFKMKKKETEYFELLVNYNQAKNHTQRKYYFEKILSVKQSKIAVTEAQHYEFYSTWYYTAVREIVDLYPVKDNYEEVARLVNPPIKSAEAEKALRFLENIGFIAKGLDGCYKQTERFITTGFEAKAVAISNFLLSTADLAKMAVERLPRDTRSMSTLTFGVSEEGYKAIEDRLKDFRREVLEIVRADKDPDQVYHINFHVFPMSRPVRERKKA
jgi:uncharacterized protein (TIGR02147 family)